MPNEEQRPGSSLRPVPCCIEAPACLVRKAEYALITLLRPLGLVPSLISRDELGEGGIYYGPSPELIPGALSLSYSEHAARYFAQWEPSGLRQVEWVRVEGERWPILFRAEGGAPDLVASAFYWLSGWQEYTSPARDEHGRFPYAASLQRETGTALRPCVDAYREMLAALLSAAGIPYAQRKWRAQSWAFCATHDIDYLYKWRGAAVLRLLLGKSQPVGERPSPLGGVAAAWSAARSRLSGRDPFALAWQRMIGEARERGFRATYFLKGDASDPHDVPYSLQDASFSVRLEELKQVGFEVGVHPAYRAHVNTPLMKAERDRIRRRTGEHCVSVRQHYLRYDPERTARAQVEAGFLIDSTLGFAEQEGFRNGTCLPFQVYDVVNDAPLPLWEMPLALMDATIFNRRGLSVEEACAATDEVIRACRRFGGVCVANWHNLLWDEDHAGWGEHFLYTLDQAVAGAAFTGSLAESLAAWGEELSLVDLWPHDAI